MSVRQSADSVAFFQVRVDSDADLTGDDVDMAFVAPWTDPIEADWATAEWVNGASNTARRLVYGATSDPNPPQDSTVLDAGTYIVWVRVHDNPETPALPANQLTVY